MQKSTGMFQKQKACKSYERSTAVPVWVEKNPHTPTDGNGIWEEASWAFGQKWQSSSVEKVSIGGDGAQRGCFFIGTPPFCLL